MKYIFSIALIGLCGFGFSQDDPIKINSEVKSVTVYPRGAQIERSATKFLSSGRQFVVFTGLASELEASTVSVSADGGINVLSVSSQVNYLKETAKPKNLIILEDSLKTYEFDHQFNQNMVGIYAEEKNMILSNKSVGWGGAGGDFLIEDLEDLSDFFRDRLADNMLKTMELEQKQKRISASIQRLRKQINEHNAKLNRSTGEVLVEVYVPSNANAHFTLSYMVQNAGWLPAYNVNVMDVDKPLQFSYNAKVFQNTGVDWNDVTLTLTNANPNLNGNKPELHPWQLYFVENSGSLYGRPEAFSNKAMPLATSDDKVSEAESFEMGSVVEYPVNQAVTQFKIKTRHNIPSNGKPQGISIDVFTVPARYQYYCAPKVDPAAFLVARVWDFNQYDLLPGEANLFLSNTYVGQTFINPGTISDTLDLSLGRDQSIVVKREKVSEFCDSKRIGSNIKESIGMEISVKNTKETKIFLVIEDQVPISTNKEITVDVEDKSGADLNTQTGLLRWTKNIMAGSSEKMSFKYSIKYPAEKRINF
ncbi:MAG: DUF4139 domain-containing protein [Flavobacteriales bacterium]